MFETPGNTVKGEERRRTWVPTGALAFCLGLEVVWVPLAASIHELLAAPGEVVVEVALQEGEAGPHLCLQQAEAGPPWGCTCVREFSLE